MIVDSLTKEFPASESEGIFRLDNGGATAKKSRTVRRKRMHLRRLNSLSKEDSVGDGLISSDHDVLKKKRSEVKNEKKLFEKALIGQSEIYDVRRCRCGTVSHLGRRREMEDAVAIELGFLNKGGKSYDFYGVYDGHGGWRVAQACSEMMHKLLAKVLEEESGGDIGYWEKVMTTAFKDMDEEVNKNGADVATMGSTAVVAVVGEEVVVVANCGDSRAVLCRGGVAVQLSDDHKPDRPDELERIEVSGGKVINWNGARVLGVLATSRSIGDHYLKPHVIPEPEVKIINRSSADEFLILASDGLWDVISNDLACRVTRRCLDGRMRMRMRRRSPLVSGVINEDIHDDDDDDDDGRFDYKTTTNKNRCFEAAAVLAELAMGRGSSDNVSVIVVDI